MVLQILRALFVLLMAAAGYFYLDLSWIAIFIAVILAVGFVCVDILAPRQKLTIFAGVFFGLLIGIVLAYALSFAVPLLVDQAVAYSRMSAAGTDQIKQFITLLIGIICCYLSISFILQTRDDFRFIIPYIEFSKQTKGPRPVLLDTSVLIDGRIIDVATTGFLDSQVIVPRFILDELQTLADTSDGLKRTRGRRGLDMLAKLRGGSRAEVIIYDSPRGADPDASVDQRLMDLAKQLTGRIVTNDYNLSKVAQLQEVDVINVNDLSNVLRPVVLPGERMGVRLVKPGEEPGQGVGYLSDGTMVVVEQGRPYLNEEVEFTVTRALQTSAGRMVFGRMPDGTGPALKRPRGRGDAPSPAAAAGEARPTT